MLGRALGCTGMHRDAPGACLRPEEHERILLKLKKEKSFKKIEII